MEYTVTERSVPIRTNLTPEQTSTKSWLYFPGLLGVNLGLFFENLCPVGVYSGFTLDLLLGSNCTEV